MSNVRQSECQSNNLNVLLIIRGTIIDDISCHFLRRTTIAPQCGCDMRINNIAREFYTTRIKQ